MENTPSEDFDLDDFSFKPITKGLGFHPKKEEIARPFKPTPVRATRNYTQTTTTTTLVRPVKKVKEKEILLTANPRDKILAFIIDLSIITAVSILTLTMLVYGADLNIQVLISLFPFYELFLFASSIFSLYFLLYFSILDLTATPGKSLMGLELKLENGKRPQLGNTLPRAMITLLSLPLVGLPLLSNFQSRYSESEVYKK